MHRHREDASNLDEASWQIVYSFFHPEEATSVDGGSLLAGMFPDLSRPIGIASGTSLPSSSAPGFYSGRPACLTWAADENEDETNFWRAQIMVTTGLGFEESVLVTVTDSHGESIEAAKLILLNSTLEVSDGTAVYSLAEFQQNLANTNVALIYPDGRYVEGFLKLNVD